MTWSIRQAVERDHPELLALNNSAVPHVNALTVEQFVWLAAHSDYFRICEGAAGIAGSVIAIANGTGYWSANYAWFSERYDRFLYLDRVVVAERGRRAGAGRALYSDLERFASGRWPRILLEVNLRPPNPGSLRFHEQMEFREVGVRESDDGEKAVVMLEREVRGQSVEPPVL